MMDSFSGKDLPFLGALIAAPGNEFPRGCGPLYKHPHFFLQTKTVAQRGKQRVYKSTTLKLKI
jgi:hypothetical protein